jgi:two-component system, NarL family, nitrate/nitrite response regulator NarL
MIDIVLGDDHAAFADALATVLTDDRRRVVAVERTATGVLAAVRERTPDLCLLDRWFDDGDGFALLPALIQSSPRTRTIVVTADPDRDAVRQALEHGAHGFVHKTRGASALLGALDKVLEGEQPVELPPRWTTAKRSGTGGRPVATHLTVREHQCLALLVEGASTPQMAAQLDVSVTTVRTHVQAVMTKLGVHTRLEAAAYAVRHGLVPATREPAGRRA